MGERMSYSDRFRFIVAPRDMADAEALGAEADAEITALKSEIDALWQRVAELEAALREVCDDYEEVVDGEFGPDPEPIECVVRARALLGEGGEG
jgi:septation ring formation regulator EzrA